MIKNCERCGNSFECLANDIQNCACNKLELPKEYMAYLNQKYKNCLCLGCLKAELLSFQNIEGTSIHKN